MDDESSIKTPKTGNLCKTGNKPNIKKRAKSTWPLLPLKSSSSSNFLSEEKLDISDPNPWEVDVFAKTLATLSETVSAEKLCPLVKEWGSVSEIKTALRRVVQSTHQQYLKNLPDEDFIAYKKYTPREFRRKVDKASKALQEVLAGGVCHMQPAPEWFGDEEYDTFMNTKSGLKEYQCQIYGMYDELKNANTLLDELQRGINNKKGKSGAPRNLAFLASNWTVNTLIQSLLCDLSEWNKLYFDIVYAVWLDIRLFTKKDNRKGETSRSWLKKYMKNNNLMLEQ
jgi:hypothetical protein